MGEVLILGTIQEDLTATNLDPVPAIIMVSQRYLDQIPFKKCSTNSASNPRLIEWKFALFYFKMSLAEQRLIKIMASKIAIFIFQCRKLIESFWLGPNFVGSPPFHFKIHISKNPLEHFTFRQNSLDFLSPNVKLHNRYCHIGHRRALFD